MQKAKAFAFVALGILALVAAFHLGARSAQGQAPGVVAAAVPSNPYLRDSAGNAYYGVLMENGDAYGWRTTEYGGPTVGVAPQYLGNLFSGAPVQTQGTTWGRIKAERR